MEELTTHDVDVAAYLMARGCRLVRVLPGYFAGFVFADGDGQAGAALDAWNGAEPISPCSLLDAVREVRRLAYRGRYAA